jgi:hypothetical protein
MNINLVPAIGGQGLWEHPEIPQGLKPSNPRGIRGTTEVVPCYKTDAFDHPGCMPESL